MERKTQDFSEKKKSCLSTSAKLLLEFVPCRLLSVSVYVSVFL
jgi:hypothetical protein